MGELAEGWVATSLDQVCDVNGGIQKQAKRRPVVNKFPFLRVANVGRGTLDLSEVHEVELFEGELDRFRLKAGDLLVVEGNGSPDQIGRAATWRGTIPDAVHQNHLIRVRPTQAIDPKFLELLWNSPVVKNQLMSVAQSSSGLYTLSTAKLKRVQLNLPPLVEQHRIVEALEEQLSRLDAAKEGAERSLKRIDILGSTLLTSALASTTKVAKLADVLASPLINGRSVKTLEGGFPVLRLTAIKDGRLDLCEFKTGAWDSEDAKPYLVEKGDFLISRGNGSLKLVGRGGLAGEVKEGVAFPDTMIRVRANPAIATPEFLSLIWGTRTVRRQIESRARTTAGIYKVNQQILESIEFPLPSLDEQLAMVRRREAEIDYLAAVRTSAGNALRRCRSLENALLRKSLSGNLLPQNPADEPATTLLARIAAERNAAKPARKGRHAARPRKATAAAAAPAPAPTPAPVTTVQQELFQ